MYISSKWVIFNCFNIILFSSLLLGACQTEVVTSLPPTPTTDIRPILSDIKGLVAEKAYVAALDGLKNVPRSNEYSDVLNLMRGDIYLKLSRWDEAESIFEQVLQTKRGNYTATVGLAESLLNQGRVAEAEIYWQQAIDLEETNSQGWVGLAEIYLLNLDFEAAQTALTEAQTYGANETATWQLAVLTLPDDFEKGLAYLNQIPASIPIKDYLLATLAPFTTTTPPVEMATTTGVALIQLEEWPLAYYTLNKATILDPTYAQAWIFLGYTETKLKLPALDSFQQARELSPDLALVPYFEGIYLREQGHIDLALARFFEALELDPGNLGVALEAAFTLAEKGDYTSAEAWYRGIAEAEPDSIPYQTALTGFFVQRNYRVADKGLLEATHLVEMAPESAEAFDLLGWAKYQSGDYPGAEESLTEALTLDPTYIPAHYHLGQVLKVLSRDLDAQEEFDYVINWDTSGLYRDRILKGN